MTEDCDINFYIHVCCHLILDWLKVSYEHMYT